MPKFSTVVEYGFLLVPLYLFVISPILSPYFGHDVSKDAAEQVSFEKIENLVTPDPDLVCPAHNYNVHVLGREPLVLYIENFVSPDEAKEIIRLSEPNFAPSPIYNANELKLDLTIRNSSRAELPRNPSVQCIEARALALQGWRTDTFIERLWTQQYQTGGHYVHHFDWTTRMRNGPGRVSSFMVYLTGEEDGVEGGGTGFPRLQCPRDEKWKTLVECRNTEEEDAEDGTGVIFRPKKGNAVYWENFDSDSRGYQETWHAGLPVTKGVKVGLNIWSWYQPGYRPPAQETEENGTMKEKHDV